MCYVFAQGYYSDMLLPFPGVEATTVGDLAYFSIMLITFDTFSNVANGFGSTAQRMFTALALSNDESGNGATKPLWARRCVTPFGTTVVLTCVQPLALCGRYSVLLG